MSCCGEREKGPPERKQRWEFIELNDFRSTSFLTNLAYGWLWFMGGVGLAVYAVDTFTAVNLLIFDRWSSQVQPKIPFEYSKWIFAGCIICSWALLIYEWVRALRVIKRDGVAASYMDPIAMSLQSMRSRGFKRFLVYTELTKSKKGTDYVAFFVYFAFQGSIRVILAEGPRQVVNALTLYALMSAKLIDGGHTSDGNSQFTQFFVNLKTIADQNFEQAMIYGSMLFTLVIWVFSALCLICAGILYIVFLWHYIPQKDGRLRIYCRRKIDRRLEKIVEHWVKEAMEQEARQREADERKREKAEKKAELKRQKTGELPPPPSAPGITRAPTLPDLGSNEMLKKEDSLSLSRQDTKSTVATLPLYTSRPSTSHDMSRQPSLPDFGEDRPPMPIRSGTQGSAWSKASFESDAPLIPNAGSIGADNRIPSPAPTYYSRQPSNASFATAPPGMPGRINTQSTQRSMTPMSATSARPPPGSRFPVRSNTGFSFDESQSARNAMSPVDGRSQTPVGPPMRVNTADGWQPGPRRQDSNVSYFSRPVAAPTPQPPPPMPTLGRHPTLESINAPPMQMTRRPTLESMNPPPMTRQMTVDSVNPPLRGPTPTARLPTRQSSFSRPFTPASTIITTPAPNSYEMTSRPPLPGPAGAAVYKPFNPTLHQHQSSTNTLVQDGPRRNVTVAGTQQALQDGPADYFSLAPPRSFTEPVGERAMSSYGSILDDYGAFTPGEQFGAAPASPYVPAPQQQQQQPQGGFRAYTPGPAPGSRGW